MKGNSKILALAMMAGALSMTGSDGVLYRGNGGRYVSPKTAKLKRQRGKAKAARKARKISRPIYK